MTSWATLPALRLALALACGIGLAAYLPPGMLWPAIAALGTLSVGATLLPTRRDTLPQVRGAGVLAGFAALGLWAGGSSPTLAPEPGELLPAGAFALIELDYVAGDTGWAAAEGHVLRLHRRGKWRDTSFGVRLMLSPGVERAGLGPGAVVATSAELRAPDGPLNPGGFDYGSYLRSRGITRQGFVYPDAVHLLTPRRQPGPVARLRTHITARLTAGIRDPAAAGIARALVLGDRGGLDDDTRGVYARTGAVHVLAVSGLHTGVVAGILLWLLGPLRRSGRAGRVSALLLLWCGLAAFAALTGFAPSVRRAAVMFGTLFAGTTLREDTNALNSLGLSALALLLLEPQLLFSLGFQLSYLAVGGIVALQPVLKRPLRSGNRYVDFAGDLLTVSIAATVATAPLTVHHFHQFPVYFAVSGLIAVPLVSVALPLLVGGLALDALLGAVGWAGDWALLPAEWAVSLCTESLATLSRAPGALAEGLWPSTATTTLLLGSVVLGGAFALRRRPRLAIAAAALLCLAGATSVAETLRRRAHRSITTYAVAGAHVTDLIGGGTYVELRAAVACADGQTVTPTDSLRSLAPNRARLNLAGAPAAPAGQYSVPISGDAGGCRLKVYAAGGKRWLLLPDVGYTPAPEAPEVDWVVVRDVNRADPEALAAAFPAARWVLTQHIPRWRTGDWAPFADLTHVLPRDGAYVVQLGGQR